MKKFLFAFVFVFLGVSLISLPCFAISEKQKFDVLAVPCSRPFVVAAEKAEEFKNQTTSPEDSAFVRDLAEKFRVNNLVEEGPVLNKTKKTNKK